MAHIRPSMSNLTAIGFDLLVCAAALALAAVLLRSEGRTGWREWWAGPWAPLAEFTTINLDFLQHYRPKVNVVERPHAHAGGRGIALTGHHELIVPLLAAALIECG